MDTTTQQEQLQSLLGLHSIPVAVAYRPSAPAGVARMGTAAPSGCSYWKRAAQGEVFYTEAEDHFNCPIGAYTHNLDLPPEKAQELQGLIEQMVGLQYIRLEEVGRIPRRTEPFGVAIYAPLAASPIPPDVVLIRGNARQMMLLTEAVEMSGVGSVGSIMGRPTCAALPAALQAGKVAASVGCIGNRVYTDLGDDELYVAIPGTHLASIVEKLATIVHANGELEAFHRRKLLAPSS